MRAIGKTPPPVRPVTPESLENTGRRRYGRISGFLLGLVMLSLLCIPTLVIYTTDVSMSSDDVVVFWAWTRTLNIPADWRLPAALAAVGLLSIVGACLPSPVRGIMLIVGGLVALFGVHLTWLQRLALGGSPGGIQAYALISFLLHCLALALFALSVGGHAANRRARGKWPPRSAIAGPCIVAPVVAVASVVTDALVGKLPPLEFGLFFPRFAPLPLGPLKMPLIVARWGTLGLLFASMALGAAFALRRLRRLSTFGYALGISGIFLIVAISSVGAIDRLARSWYERFGYRTTHTFEGFHLHVTIPVLVAIALITVGSGSLWLRDPKRTATS
jgi:hypothetical protein